jgi:hypothetical protein
MFDSIFLANIPNVLLDENCTRRELGFFVYVDTTILVFEEFAVLYHDFEGLGLLETVKF